MDLEVASKIILGANHRIKEIHPYDYIYESLNLKLLELEKNNIEYKLVKRYAKNSLNFPNKRFIKNIFALEK